MLSKRFLTTPTPTASSWRGRKKFFQTAEVKAIGDMFGIALNGKELSTPNKNRLHVKSEALARCLVHEWSMQSEKIQPSSMPLMVLTCSAIDVTSNNRAEIQFELMKYFETDTLFYFYPEQPIFHAKQIKHWNPIISAFSQKFGPVSLSTDMSTEKHPEPTYAAVEKHLNELDIFQLTAIESLASGLKSLVVPLTLFNSITRSYPTNLTFGIDEAISAARLEENHQIEEWGLVEGGHDIEQANLRVQVAAAATFVRLSNTK